MFICYFRDTFGQKQRKANFRRCFWMSAYARAITFLFQVTRSKPFHTRAIYSHLFESRLSQIARIWIWVIGQRPNESAAVKEENRVRLFNVVHLAVETYSLQKPPSLKEEKFAKLLISTSTTWMIQASGSGVAFIQTARPDADRRPSPTIEVSLSFRTRTPKLRSALFTTGKLTWRHVFRFLNGCDLWSDQAAAAWPDVVSGKVVFVSLRIWEFHGTHAYFLFLVLL